MVLEELKDGQDDVVDIAEAAGFTLLGMVKTSGPVDGDLGGLLVQLHCRGNGSSGRELAELQTPLLSEEALSGSDPAQPSPLPAQQGQPGPPST